MKRLLAPRSIALIGGTWADAVGAASRAIGYDGEIWHVHPTRESTPERRYYRSVDELPGSPDAAFIAAPNHAVPAIAAALVHHRAGGFVCFASGFSETATAEGLALTERLVASAAELPFFGPNCYGFINFFDGVALWPDQLVGSRRDRGVALICQSGTIALNLLFNDRSLPLGLVLTVGNQTRLAVEDLIEALSDDSRISAFGLYVEGIKDAARFERALGQARAAGKPVALVKAGRTEAAARTARTHTGALVGADRLFDAYCAQAGIARCETLATLCETLKVLHTGGPLRGRRVFIMGASGGDMAMTADASRHLGLEFAPIPASTAQQLKGILTERVQLSNPLDFHTHIWFDRPAMRAMFAAANGAGFDAVGFMIDCPPASQADPSAYLGAIEEFIAAYPGPPARAMLISSLPESLDKLTRARCLAAGVVPLQGQREALEALDLTGATGETWNRGAALELCRPSHPSGERGDGVLLSEPAGKAALAAFGVPVPRAQLVAPAEVAGAAAALGFPVVIKATGIAHKSDHGGVVLNVRSPEDAAAAAARLGALSERLLVEEMIVDGVAEILLGLSVDAQFGLALLLGAGGVLTELVRDTVMLLPPFTAAAIESALGRLAVAPLLRGFRGRPRGDVPALVAAILACARYACANVDTLIELDVNPIIVRPEGHGAVAVDTLIRLA